jgi:hypothetical protein
MLDLATLHRRACRVLPDKIDTDAVLLDAADDRQLAALLLPFSHRRRGCLVFRLSATTLRSLASRAALYLQDACRAREGLGRRTRPLTYAAWTQEGPGPASRFRTYSVDGRADLCLLPAAASAVYVWDDRGLEREGMRPVLR